MVGSATLQQASPQFQSQPAVSSQVTKDQLMAIHSAAQRAESASQGINGVSYPGLSGISNQDSAIMGPIDASSSEPEKQAFQHLAKLIGPYELSPQNHQLDDFEVVFAILFNRIKSEGAKTKNVQTIIDNVVKGWNPNDIGKMKEKMAENATKPMDSKIQQATQNIISGNPKTNLGRMAMVQKWTDYAHLKAMPGGKAPTYHANLNNNQKVTTSSGEIMSVGKDPGKNVPTTIGVA